MVLHILIQKKYSFLSPASLRMNQSLLDIEGKRLK